MFIHLVTVIFTIKKISSLKLTANSLHLYSTIMQKWVYINNDFVLEEAAHIPITDLAVQRGYGIFDYLKTINNKPIFIEDHLNRFYFSAEQMHLQPPLNKEEIKNVITGLIERNNLGNSGIRLTLTGGNAPDGYTVTSPALIISQQILHLPGEELFNKGVKLISIEYQRQLAQVKTIDYLMAIWMQPLLKEKGFDDILYYNRESITECPRANVFMITKNDELVTPAINILKGITRKKIFEFAPKANIKVTERAIKLDELKEAKAAFICSTTKAILPVAQLDEIIFDVKNNQRILRQLLDLLNQSIAASAH